MSDIDHVTEASTQSAVLFTSIERRAVEANATAASSRNDRAASEPEAPSLADKAAPQAGRRPLFGR